MRSSQAVLRTHASCTGLVDRRCSQALQGPARLCAGQCSAAPSLASTAKHQVVPMIRVSPATGVPARLRRGLCLVYAWSGFGWSASQIACVCGNCRPCVVGLTVGAPGRGRLSLSGGFGSGRVGPRVCMPPVRSSRGFAPTVATREKGRGEGGSHAVGRRC